LAGAARRVNHRRLFIASSCSANRLTRVAGPTDGMLALLLCGLIQQAPDTLRLRSTLLTLPVL